MLIPFVPWFHGITIWQFAASGGEGQQPAAWTSDAVSPSCEASASGASVIEFYVPATFQLPERRWIPPEARGKLIEFPARGVRKSA
jgi:hypothetical protein